VVAVAVVVVAEETIAARVHAAVAPIKTAHKAAEDRVPTPLLGLPNRNQQHKSLILSRNQTLLQKLIKLLRQSRQSMHLQATTLQRVDPVKTDRPKACPLKTLSRSRNQQPLLIQERRLMQKRSKPPQAARVDRWGCRGFSPGSNPLAPYIWATGWERSATGWNFKAAMTHLYVLWICMRSRFRMIPSN
jgi:hypothetical protein